jgi:hypothetical protein
MKQKRTLKGGGGRGGGVPSSNISPGSVGKGTNTGGKMKSDQG